MKQKSNTKVNLIYNMIYQVLILILPLITTPYISRVVGVEGVGIYSYYYSIALYFSYFAMLGISNFGNRKIAKNRDDNEKRNKVFSSVYALQLISSSIILVLYLLFSLLIINENEIIAIVMIFYVGASVFDVSWVFFGLEEFKITSLRQIIIRILTLIFIFGLVKNKSDLTLYSLIMALGNFISALSLWIIVWKRVKWRKISFSDIKENIRPCIILFIPIIATSIYRQMDKIMLGNIINMSEVGFYENAEKLISISLGVISSFSAVIMPKISNLISKEQINEVKKLFINSMEFAMCIGMAIAFGIVSIVDEFIPIFFGDEFLPSIRLSKFLTITVPFISWANIVRVLYLIPREKDRIYVHSIIIGAILNTVVNAIFIPFLGAMGAVIGTIVAEASVACYQTYKIRKELNLAIYLKKGLIFFFFGLIMLVTINMIKRNLCMNVKSLILEILAGGSLYCVMVIGYFISSKNEILYNVIKKLKDNSRT